MSSVTIRVDQETKEAAMKVVEDFGLDLSSVTRAFYRQIVREQRIPLRLSYPEPNDESASSVRDAEARLAEGGGGYRTARELLDAATQG